MCRNIGESAVHELLTMVASKIHELSGTQFSVALVATSACFNLSVAWNEKLLQRLWAHRHCAEGRSILLGNLDSIASIAVLQLRHGLCTSDVPDKCKKDKKRRVKKGK